MTIPNIITVARLILIPVIILMAMREEWKGAFVLFVAAGVSDGVDGFIARRFHMESRFGAYVDPLADKALMVSVYLALAVTGTIPIWLTFLVVGRDILIVAGVLIAMGMGRPVEIKPLMISKLNTVAQIGFAALMLGMKAFGMSLGGFEPLAILTVAALTVASAGAYLLGWLSHMAGAPAGEGDAKGPGRR